MAPSSRTSRSRLRPDNRNSPTNTSSDYRTSARLADEISLIEKGKIAKRLERLAWLTDNSIPIPGMKAKVGIDPLIGLVPWFGDALGALLSSYIITQAANLGVPKSVLVKMAFNVALDALVGMVPGVGDLFDFAWKANLRNVQLLESYVERPQKTVVTSRLFVASLVLLLICAVIIIGLIGFLLVRWLWMMVNGHQIGSS